MSTLPDLNRSEWEAMMANVLLDEVSIDPTDRWNSVQSPTNKGNDAGGAKTETEIPDNHPAKGGPVTPEGEADDQIPAGGGFATKPAATPETGPVSKEIPSDGPASSDSPADKPDKVDDNKWAVKVGKPDSTGKPSGSFAEALDVKYDGTSWTVAAPIVPSSKTVEQWSGGPSGTSDGTGPSKTPDKWGSTDANAAKGPAPRTDADPGKMNADADKKDDDDKEDVKKDKNGKPLPPWLQKKAKADEDLDKDRPDNLSLPDGTFLTQNTDDLINNIAKVKNADQTNPRTSSHPWYVDIKRHLANRAADLGASHLIPADWNLSMAMLAEREIARDIDTATREEYVKKGWALKDKSYPIGNAGDLRNAIDLARSGHGNVSAAKALIRRRAKDLDVKLPPDFS